MNRFPSAGDAKTLSLAAFFAPGHGWSPSLAARGEIISVFGWFVMRSSGSQCWALSTSAFEDREHGRGLPEFVRGQHEPA